MLRADRGVYRWNRVWSRSVRETNDGVCLTGLCVVYVREGANSLHPHFNPLLPSWCNTTAGVFFSSFITISQPQPCEFFFCGCLIYTTGTLFSFLHQEKTKKQQKNPKTKPRSTSCQTLHLRSLQRHLRKQCNTCNTLAISKGFSWLFLRLQLQFHSQRMPNVGPSIRRSTVFWLSLILLPW